MTPPTQYRLLMQKDRSAKGTFPNQIKKKVTELVGGVMTPPYSNVWNIV